MHFPALDLMEKFSAENTLDQLWVAKTAAKLSDYQVESARVAFSEVGPCLKLTVGYQKNYLP